MTLGVPEPFGTPYTHQEDDPNMSRRDQHTAQDVDPRHGGMSDPDGPQDGDALPMDPLDVIARQYHGHCSAQAGASRRVEQLEDELARARSVLQAHSMAAESLGQVIKALETEERAQRDLPSELPPDYWSGNGRGDRDRVLR